MLLEYFTILFQIFIVTPYIIKLKQFVLVDFSCTLASICSLFIHYFVFFFLFGYPTILKKEKLGRFLLLFFATVPYLIFEISLFVFNYRFDRFVILSAFENEKELIFNFINYKIVIFSILYIALMYFIVKRIKYNEKVAKVCFPISAVVLSLVMLFSLEKYRVYLTASPLMDFFDLLGINETIIGKKSKVNNKPYMKDEEELKKLFSIKDINNLNVVLVIGESARSDFFNKYAEVLNEKNVINFIKSKSGYIYTREAVPEILTLELPENRYSIVNIMNSIGFNTFWIGTQAISGFFDGTYAHFALDSKVHIYKDNNRNLYYDFELLKYLDMYINNEGNNFYVIHLIGSHPAFIHRFKSKDARFKNYCRSKDMTLCTEEQKNNLYANTIAATDFVLREIIERFKDKNTILLFTSDHSVKKVFLNKEEDDSVVPAFMWLNGDSIKHKSVIEKNAKKFDFAHKKIVSSLLDCTGARSDIIDIKNSICSLDYE